MSIAYLNYVLVLTFKKILNHPTGKLKTKADNKKLPAEANSAGSTKFPVLKDRNEKL